jgi:hypothetical protein
MMDIEDPSDSVSDAPPLEAKDCVAIAGPRINDMPRDAAERREEPGGGFRLGEVRIAARTTGAVASETRLTVGDVDAATCSEWGDATSAVDAPAAAPAAAPGATAADDGAAPPGIVVRKAPHWGAAEPKADALSHVGARGGPPKS